MVIVLERTIQDRDKAHIRDFLVSRGYTIREIVGEEETILGAVGTSTVDVREVEMLAGVARVIPITSPYKLASREFRKDDTIISLGDPAHPVRIGGLRIVVIAGPCAVESRAQTLEIAALVRESGAVLFRGGAWKPRTSPYAFQGLGEEALAYLKEAGEAEGLPVVSEIVSPEHVDLMKDYVDVLQIGARNMQNFELLKRVGSLGKPVLLKRGLAATIQDLLMSAEYLLAAGTEQRHPLREGDPHLRDIDAQHPRPLRHSGGEEAEPSAHDRRSQPWHGDPRQGEPHGPGGGGGRRGRDHRGGALRSREGAFRRAAVPVPRPVRKAHARHRGPCARAGQGAGAAPRGRTSRARGRRRASAAGRRARPSRSGRPRRRARPPLPWSSPSRGSAARSASTPSGTGSPRRWSAQPVPEFAAVFDAVLQGRARFGMVPIENSLTGSIHQNYDLLLQYPDIRIVGEQKIRIVHNLIGLPGTRLERHPAGLLPPAGARAVRAVPRHPPRVGARGLSSTPQAPCARGGDRGEGERGNCQRGCGGRVYGLAAAQAGHRDERAELHAVLRDRAGRAGAPARGPGTGPVEGVALLRRGRPARRALPGAARCWPTGAST